jgi:hypothetical protein
MGNPFVITNKQAGGIAITAAEGGTGYWGQMDQYDWTRWLDEESMNPKPIADDFVFYTITEWDDETGTYSGRKVVVTPRLIKRGWRKAMVEFRHTLDLEDPDCTDTIGADVIVQLGAWGEVVYG